jgi:hypothetical protein
MVVVVAVVAAGLCLTEERMFGMGRVLLHWVQQGWL